MSVSSLSSNRSMASIPAGSDDDFDDVSDVGSEDSVSGTDDDASSDDDQGAQVQNAAQLGLEKTDIAFWLVRDGFKALGTRPDGTTQYEIKAGFGKLADRKIAVFNVYARSDREALIWMQAVSSMHELKTLTRAQFNDTMKDWKTRNVTFGLAISPVADKDGGKGLWLYHKDGTGACVRYVHKQAGSGNEIHPILSHLSARNLDMVAGRGRRDYEERVRAREARASRSRNRSGSEASDAGSVSSWSSRSSRRSLRSVSSDSRMPARSASLRSSRASSVALSDDV